MIIKHSYVEIVAILGAIFTLLFICALFLFWGGDGFGYYHKVKNLEGVLAEKLKVIETVVDNGWHLPEIKGYVAEIKYKKMESL